MSKGERRARRRRRVLAAFLLSGCAFAGWFRKPLFGGNFGIVDPDRVYRSAQPNSRLAGWIDQFHLASVLNLRGGSAKDAFYREEQKIVQTHQLNLLDVPLSATEQPSRTDLLALISALRQAKYPLLIHCRQGADRTGLGTAVYRMMKLGVPPTEALYSFQLEHAHVPLMGPEKLHIPLEQYAEWLRRSGLSHTPARFERWVRTQYIAPERKHHQRPDQGTISAETASQDEVPSPENG